MTVVILQQPDWVSKGRNGLQRQEEEESGMEERGAGEGQDGRRRC